MKKISSEDRKSLIRLASSLPQGSPERKAILAGLKKTSAFEPFTEKQYQELEDLIIKFLDRNLKYAEVDQVYRSLRTFVDAVAEAEDMAMEKEMEKAQRRESRRAGLKSAYHYHEKMPRRGKPTLFKGDRVMFYAGGAGGPQSGTIKALYTDRGVDFADIRGDNDKFYEGFEVFGLEKIK